MRKPKVIRKYLQYKQNRRVDFSSIGAEMSRHVGAKSQRFLDFNFSKAFLVSFLKILSSHSTLINQSESMEDFKNLKKGNFEKKTMIKRKWSEPDTHPSHVVELFVYFLRFDFIGTIITL